MLHISHNQAINQSVINDRITFLSPPSSFCYQYYHDHHRLRLHLFFPFCLFSFLLSVSSSSSSRRLRVQRGDPTTSTHVAISTQEGQLSMPVKLAVKYSLLHLYSRGLIYFSVMAKALDAQLTPPLISPISTHSTSNQSYQHPL